MRNILLIEDDPEITKLLSLHFTSAAYEVTCCTTGQEALRCLREKVYQLVILDITLPDSNGMQLCQQVRTKDKVTPVLMLTCHADESDKVLALELGADDYVTKPFGVLELMARVRALLRRAENNTKESPAAEDQLSHKDLCLDAGKRKATLNGKRLDLTTKEFDLLWLLASHPGKPFSRQQILEQLWGIAFNGYEHTITSHINRLRLKLEKDLSNPQYILTAWGTGYRFAE